MNNIFILFTLAGSLLIVISIITFLIKRKSKKMTGSYTSTPIPRPIVKPPGPQDESYPNVIVKSEDRTLYDKFIQEYDPNGNFKFNGVGYRKGAAMTCGFGISEGYKYDAKGTMHWGYVRLHTGVDRANGATIKNISDVVMAPFKFDKTAILEYKDKNGNWYGYGSLILLYNNEYNFQMRIAHMDPVNNIMPWAYKRLKNGMPFEAGWIIGSAGTCGNSSGNHTHTEIISTDESSEVLDILLQEQYGDKVLVEYTKAEIIKEYRKHSHFANATESKILKDWQAVKNQRGATFANKYKYKYNTGYGSTFTRYASNLLFNGL